MIPRESPGGSLEGPWRVPGGSLGRSRSLRTPIQTPFEELVKFFWKIKCTGDQKISILGPGRDPKMHQKSILGPKSAARNRFFIEFSRTHRFSNFQAQFLINVWWKLKQKTIAFFNNFTHFFKPGDTLKTCTGAVFWALYAFLNFLKFAIEYLKKCIKNGILKRHRKLTPRRSQNRPKMA